MSTPPVLRVEVTDQYGTVAEILDAGDVLGKLRPRQREQLDALAAGLVGRVACLLGSDEDHARRVVVTDLIRLVADEQAYERVAGRRGLLPL